MDAVPVELGNSTWNFKTLTVNLSSSKSATMMIVTVLYTWDFPFCSFDMEWELAGHSRSVLATLEARWSHSEDPVVGQRPTKGFSRKCPQCYTTLQTNAAAARDFKAPSKPAA